MLHSNYSSTLVLPINSSNKILFLILLFLFDIISITNNSYFTLIDLFPLDLTIQIRQRRDGSYKIRYLNQPPPPTLSNLHLINFDHIRDVSDLFYQLYHNRADLITLLCILRQAPTYQAPLHEWHRLYWIIILHIILHIQISSSSLSWIPTEDRTSSDRYPTHTNKQNTWHHEWRYQRLSSTKGSTHSNTR